jgi:F0F1-type ATP synthase delta subunit
MTPASVSALELANAKHPGKSIELLEKVDPSLIGGVT